MSYGHSTAARLATWWGPKGSSTSFEQHDLRAGGVWRLTMKGPDGSAYPLVKDVLEVVPSKRIVVRQSSPAEHAFTTTMTFLVLDGDTQLTWRMAFDSEDEAEEIRAVVTGANEENFDRLAAHLAR